MRYKKQSKKKKGSLRINNDSLRPKIGFYQRLYFALTTLMISMLFHTYYFFNVKNELANVMFFSSIFLIIITSLLKFLNPNDAECASSLSKMGLVFFANITISMLAINAYYWESQAIAPYLLGSQILIILISALISWGLMTKNYMDVWAKDNVRINDNICIFGVKNLYKGAYSLPKNPILRALCKIALMPLKILFVILVLLGIGAGNVIMAIIKAYLDQSVDPYYFGLIFISLFFLPAMVACCFPLISYMIWWNKTKKALLKEYGTFIVRRRT